MYIVVRKTLGSEHVSLTTDIDTARQWIKDFEGNEGVEVIVFKVEAKEIEKITANFSIEYKAV